MLESAKQCRHLGGFAPLGYKVNSEGFYEIDNLKSPIISDIFRLYLQGMGYNYIINHLRKKGYKTAENNDFSKASINAILKNKKYMGTYVYDKSTPKNSEGKRNSHTCKEKYVEIPNGMPAIISADDFNKVQEKMAENANKHSARASKNYYALNGKIHCDKCGKAISGNVNHSNGRKYYQYRADCQCKVKSVNMENLNRFVFYAIKQCVFNSNNKDKIMQIINAKLATQRSFQTAEINAILSKINGLEVAQNNLTGYLESGKATDTILNKIQKNENELCSLKFQLEAKSKEISSVDDETYGRLVGKFVDYMGTVKSSETVALRNAIVNNIAMNNSDITINFNHGLMIDDKIIKYFNDNMEV